MTILPLDPRANDSPEALIRFLAECQAVARKRGQPQLVSISLEVDALDPLAVLESIFEPSEQHFYVERPSEGFALAGAEAVVKFEARGEDRFRACRDFVDQVLANTLAVGDLEAAFSGPHFFHAFAFAAETEPNEPFAAATVFVPRWQVSARDGRTTAVANVLVKADQPVDAAAQRVWRARQKFTSFDYAEPGFSRSGTVRQVAVAEAGSADAYKNAVEAAVSRIRAGEFKKIVLARAKDLVGEQPFHPLRVLNGLRQRFNDCYAFSLANGLGQSLIGASPERLVKVRQGEVTTEALAGSARRGATASEDAALGGQLLRSEKDLTEHDYVVSAIARRLEPLGLRFGKPPKPALRRLANVQHLHTPLRAPLPPGVRVLDVLERLHPTPAVGGSPREAAVPCIRALEGFPRGLYAGALGWLDARGEGEFFVALRSALVNGATARLYAGAGIVAGSDPEKEFQETELKFSALMDALSAR